MNQRVLSSKSLTKTETKIETGATVDVRWTSDTGNFFPPVPFLSRGESARRRRASVYPHRLDSERHAAVSNIERESSAKELLSGNRRAFWSGFFPLAGVLRSPYHESLWSSRRIDSDEWAPESIRFKCEIIIKIRHWRGKSADSRASRLPFDAWRNRNSMGCKQLNRAQIWFRESIFIRWNFPAFYRRSRRSWKSVACRCIVPAASNNGRGSEPGSSFKYR